MTTASALIVTYNHARYIAEAIRSALDQSRPPDEVIVVDDGSSDATVEVAKAIDDPRVRVMSRSHHGIADLFDTYNAGIDACRGDLVALLEGDDRWPSDKLARQVQAFEDEAVVLTHGLYSVIGANGGRLHRGVWPSLRIPPGTYEPLRYILRGSYIMAVTVVLRRRAVLAAGGFRQLEGTPHWDYPTFLALASQGNFNFDPHVDGEWRRHGESATFRLAGSDLRGIELSARLARDALRSATGSGLPDVADVDRGWCDAYAHMIWQAGRVLLLSRRYAEARRLLLPAMLRPSSFPLRMRLLLGSTAAICHLNVEPLLRLLGRQSTFRELN